MVSQEFLTTIDQVGEERCCLLCLGTLCREHIGTKWFAGNIMRRRATQPFVAPLDDKQVTILNTCIEMHSLAAKLCVEIVYEHAGILRLKASTAMILQQVAVDAHQITSHSQVAWFQFHPDAGCFEWAATFIYLMLVISQNTAVGHLASGMESVGHGLQHAAATMTGQPVEMRHIGMLQECLPLQLHAWPIGHAIGQYNKMFHTKTVFMPTT